MEEINLKTLVNYVLERVKLIGIITLVFFLVGAIYTVINRPTYEAVAKVAVAGTDMNSNRSLSTSYANSVNNTTVLNNVIVKLDLKDNASKLSGKVTAESAVDSDIITIHVNDTNKKRANKIANEVSTQFIDYVENTYNNKNLRVLTKSSIVGDNIVVKYAKKVIVFIVSGAIFAVAIIFVKFYFDNSVKAEDDIKSLGLNIYGVIPTEEELKNDSYLNIKSNITTNTLDKTSKVVLITSTDEIESKSNVVADLAKTYANIDKKVLVIDTDLKNDNQSKLFDLNKVENGYTDLINSKSNTYASFITKTSNKNIDVITNGNKVADEVEVISSSKNETIIDKLKENYDVIIIDTPPVIGTNGTLEIASNSDINLLVVENQKTNIDSVKNAKDLFNNKLNGVIINNVNTKIKNYSLYLTKHYYNK